MIHLPPRHVGVVAAIAAATALALTPVVGAGVASGSTRSTRHSATTPTVTRTVTVTKTARATKTQPGAPALVSQRLAALGSSITSPRGPYLARPNKITFATSRVGSGLAVYVDHLRWVDWSQPVAYASGIVHTRDWQQAGFVATPGGVIVDQLLSCEGRSYYTYSEMFAPAGYPYNSQDTSAGQSGRSLTPCA